MGLKIIGNRGARDAAELRITNASDTATDNTDAKEALKGGHRHLKHVASSAGTRRYVYINKAGNLDCDHIVITDAHQWAGSQMNFHAWSTYTSTIDTTTNATSPALIGAKSKDYVHSGLDVVGMEAIGLEILSPSSAIELGSFYIDSALDIDGWDTSEPVVIEPNDCDNDFILDGKYYQVSELATLRFQCLTDATVEALQTVAGIHNKPIFFYDENGYHLPGKLWHAIVISKRVISIHHDNNDVSITIGRLKEYGEDTLENIQVSPSTLTSTTAIQAPTVSTEAPYLSVYGTFNNTMYIDCGTQLGTDLGSSVSAISVSLWTERSATGDDGFFTIGDLSNSQGELTLLGFNNDLYVRLSGSSYSKNATIFPTTGFINIIVTYDGSNVNTYVDGTKNTSLSGAHTTALNLSGLTTAIGTYYNTTYGILDANVGEVEVYSKALTQNEVTYISSEGASGTDPGTGTLEAHWKINEGSGSTISDSANSYDGTVQNFNGTIFWGG